MIVEISFEILSQIFQETSKRYPYETGGVLVGRKSENIIRLAVFVGPGPNAIHDKYSYTPDDEYDEQKIAEVYHATDGDQTYLGDWHSHPATGAYLSEKDKGVIKKTACYIPARLPDPIMIVIGTDPIEIKAWIYKKNPLLGTPYQSLKVSLAT